MNLNKVKWFSPFLNINEVALTICQNCPEYLRVHSDFQWEGLGT